MLSKPGTYALILLSNCKKEIQVGRIGRLRLKPGFYFYVGSAFGPGGLKSRLSHHEHIAEHPRWHVDYLRAVTYPQGVWYTYDPVHREHEWAKMLSGTKKSSTPLEGFGSSDCSCTSHLVFFNAHPSGRAFSRKIHAQCRGHERVHMNKNLRSG